MPHEFIGYSLCLLHPPQCRGLILDPQEMTKIAGGLRVSALKHLLRCGARHGEGGGCSGLRISRFESLFKIVFTYSKSCMHRYTLHMNCMLWALCLLRKNCLGVVHDDLHLPNDTPSLSCNPFSSAIKSAYFLKIKSMPFNCQECSFRKLPSVVGIKSFPCVTAWTGDNSGLNAAKLLAQEESKISGFTNRGPNLHSSTRKLLLPYQNNESNSCVETIKHFLC